MADEDSNSSTADGSRKRRKLDTKVPAMFKLVTTKTINANDLHEQGGAGAATGHQIPRNAEDVVVASLLNRGCRRYAVSSPKTRSETEHDYYVGIEGTEFSPVYLRGFLPTSNSAFRYAQDPEWNANDYSGTSFGVGNTKKTGHFIIPPVDMFRPGQMTFLKKLSIGAGIYHSREDFSAQFREVLEEEVDTYVDEQTSNFREGRACSILINDPDLQLDYNSIPTTTTRNWAGFQMRMPRIKTSIPHALRYEIDSFLLKYPYDMVDEAFAVSMALVWCHLSSAPGFQPELCTIKPGTDPQEGQARRVVPKPSLAVFLLYAPHFFRFHEEHRLGVYGHIFRYACSMYTKDAAYDEAFHISSKDISEKKILEEFSNLGPEDLKWIEIVPPSFDGSQIPMPLNQGTRAPRSKRTTASLFLPDVYTLGLQDYQNQRRKDHGLVMRKVMVHRSWATTAMRLEPSIKRYDGPMCLTKKWFQRYNAEDGPQLWTTPKKIVRLPWRGVNMPFTKTAMHNTSMFGEVHTSSSATDRDLDQHQPERHQGKMIHQEAVIEFSRKLVIQFRKARDSGFISPSVRLGDHGLTWDGMQESDKFTRRLPPSISLNDMVSADAALQADLLNQQDRSILQKLLATLDHVHGIPQRVKDFASTLNQSDSSLTRSKTAALMEETGEQVDSAMNQMMEYGNGQQRAMDTFTEHIIKPCCVLLDLDYPGSHAEGHRAIVQADFEVGMIISDVMYQAMLPGSDGLRDATEKLRRSKKFMVVWQFLLLKDKFKGVVFNEERRDLWAWAFGEPYDAETPKE